MHIFTILFLSFTLFDGLSCVFSLPIGDPVVRGLNPRNVGIVERSRLLYVDDAEVSELVPRGRAGKSGNSQGKKSQAKEKIRIRHAYWHRIRVSKELGHTEDAKELEGHLAVYKKEFANKGADSSGPSSSGPHGPDSPGGFIHHNPHDASPSPKGGTSTQPPDGASSSNGFKGFVYYIPHDTDTSRLVEHKNYPPHYVGANSIDHHEASTTTHHEASTTHYHEASSSGASPRAHDHLADSTPPRAHSPDNVSPGDSSNVIYHDEGPTTWNGFTFTPIHKKLR